MENRIKYLKVSYQIEMVLGILVAGYMSIFLGVMATDAPTSTNIHFVFGALFGFTIVAIPTVLMPFLAIRELNNYKEKGKLTFNIINVVIVLAFVFFPLALWQFYILYKIKNGTFSSLETTQKYLDDEQKILFEERNDTFILTIPETDQSVWKVIKEQLLSQYEPLGFTETQIDKGTSWMITKKVKGSYVSVKIEGSTITVEAFKTDMPKIELQRYLTN